MKPVEADELEDLMNETMDSDGEIEARRGIHCRRKQMLGA